MAGRRRTEEGHLSGVVLPGDQVDIHSGVTPLMLACYDGEVGKVQKILQTGYQTIQVSNRYNARALDYAVDNHQVQVVDILLGYGADLDDFINDGQGILHRCVLTRQLEKVTTCIHVGANLDLRNKNGDTALHVAIQNQLVQIASVLIQNACDTTARNREGFTAHEYAFIYLSDNLEIQRALSPDSGDTLHELVSQQFLYACSTGNVDHMEAIISEYGEQVVHLRGEGNVTPVFLASHNGHLDALKILCRHRSNVNMAMDDGDSPLIYATGCNHIEVVRYLITQGARVNFRNAVGRTALHCATIEQNIEIVKILVTNGTLINLRSENGSTALYIAAERNSLDTVKYLLEHGALIDAVNEIGSTPLMQAVCHNNMETIQYLIEHGANIEQYNYLQHTPLIAAVSQNKLALVQYLVEHGADIDGRSPEGFTIPEFASACGNHEISRYLTDMCNRPKQSTGGHQNNDILNISDDLSLQQYLFGMVYNGNGTHDDLQLLIRKGADINEMDNTGRTPLIIAIVHSHSEHVAWLIHEQVNVNLTDSSGCPPLIHAVLVDNLTITELLLKWHRVPPLQIYTGGVNPIQSQTGDVHPLRVQTGAGHPVGDQNQTSQQLHVDQTDSTGKTALAHSAESHHRFANQIATKLICYGADVNIVDSAQQTILEKCVCRGKSELVDLLLENGALLLPLCPGLLVDICLSSDARTLGHCMKHLLTSNSEKCGPYINLVLNFVAANCNNLDKGGLFDILNTDILCQMMKFVTPGKLDINCQDENRGSLGMTAAGTGRLELVQVLLQRGVVPKFRNEHDQRVVCLALEKGQYEVIPASVSTGTLEQNSSDLVIVTPGADKEEVFVKENDFEDIQVEPNITDLKSLWRDALNLVYDSVMLTLTRKPPPFIRGISRGWLGSVLYIHVDELDSDQCENYINCIPHIEMYRRELVTASHLATPLTSIDMTSYIDKQYSVSTQRNNDNGWRGRLKCVFKNWSTGAYCALTTADAVYPSSEDVDHVQSCHQLLDIQLQKAYVIKSCCGLKSVNIAALPIQHIDILRNSDLGLSEFVFHGNDSSLLQRKVMNSAAIQGLGEEVQGIVIDANVSFQDQDGQFYYGAFVVSSVDENQVFAESGQSGAAVVDTDSGIVLGLVVAAQHEYLGHYKHVTFCLRLDHALMELYQRYNVNIGKFRTLEKEDG